MVVKGEVPGGARLNLRSVLDELRVAVAERPASPLLRWQAGEWTVADFDREVRRCASALFAKGIGPGDRVALVHGNAPERIALQCGIYMCGAIEVSVNTDLRGLSMQHVLDVTDPALVVTDTELSHIVRNGTHGFPVVDHTDLMTGLAADPRDPSPADPEPGDPATIIFTSGTTGPPKGVVLSHGYLANNGALLAAAMEVRPADTLYFCLPFFHVDHHVMFPSCLITGSTFALASRFSARNFWKDIEDFDASWFIAVGAIVAVLAKRGRPENFDRLRLRFFMAAPAIAEAYEFFEDELGVPQYEIYGQTEAASPCYGTAAKRRRGSAGWPCTGFDMAIVDADDNELPNGEVGEIVYRPTQPWTLMSGYWRDEQSTADAWRNLWFHSGDYGMLDDDGFLWFKGRMTDSLRRRGENVSAWEVEQVILEAPGVQHCAIVGVPDELGGEQEIKAFIIPTDDGPLDYQALFKHCEDNLPRAAVPRFVEVITPDSVVRSPGTGVIQKHRLPTAHGAHVVDRLSP